MNMKEVKISRMRNIPNDMTAENVNNITSYINDNFPLPSSGYHLNNNDFLQDKKENYQNCSVLCTTVVRNGTRTHTREQFFMLSVDFTFSFLVSV